VKKETAKTVIIVTLFAIAMGILEAAVVVYLRNLFYPAGFAFPLVGFIEPSILSVEWIREFATIVMLITIGMLAGKRLYDKFAYFIYAFAIWDIFYYIWLKVVLDWPISIITWDILFLIPWPWAGPVLAPVLCSILMIITAFIILSANKKMAPLGIDAILVVVGMILVLFTWIYDYGALIISNGFAKDFFTLTNNSQFYQVIGSYSPDYYNWPLFLIGFAMSSIGVLLFYIKNRPQNK